MSYFGTIYGNWTNRDAEGDRMRIAAEFRSDEEITADSEYVDLYVVFTGEYDLGAGDPITDSNYTFVTGGYWGAASGMNGNISGTAGAASSAGASGSSSSFLAPSRTMRASSA